MSRSSLYVTILVAALILLMVGCRVREEAVPISNEEAISIATERVEADDVMSLADREVVVEDAGDEWHIYFLPSDPEVLGGEPHVFISKEDGSITRIFYTQ
ncbi:MAG: hypothetical protein ACE5IG_04955 [Dehalococcoidia bacterium]